MLFRKVSLFLFYRSIKVTYIFRSDRYVNCPDKENRHIPKLFIPYGFMQALGEITSFIRNQNNTIRLWFGSNGFGSLGT